MSSLLAACMAALALAWTTDPSVGAASASVVETLLGVQGLILATFGGLFTWAMWSLRKATPTREEHTALKERVSRMEGAVQTIEQTLQKLPGHEDLADLRTDLERVHGDVRSLDSAFKRVENLVSAIHSHLLQGSK